MVAALRRRVNYPVFLAASPALSGRTRQKIILVVRPGACQIKTASLRPPRHFKRSAAAHVLRGGIACRAHRKTEPTAVRKTGFASLGRHTWRFGSAGHGRNRGNPCGRFGQVPVAIGAAAGSVDGQKKTSVSRRSIYATTLSIWASSAGAGGKNPSFTPGAGSLPCNSRDG